MAVSRSCDKCTGFWRNHSVSVTTAKSSVAAAERIMTKSETGLSDVLELRMKDMAPQEGLTYGEYEGSTVTRVSRQMVGR